MRLRGLPPLTHVLVTGLVLVGALAVVWSSAAQRREADRGFRDITNARSFSSDVTDLAYRRMADWVSGRGKGPFAGEPQALRLDRNLRAALRRPDWDGRARELVREQHRIFHRLRRHVETDPNLSRGRMTFTSILPAVSAIARFRASNIELVDELIRRRKAGQRRAALAGIAMVLLVLLTGLAAFLAADMRARRIARRKASLAALGAALQRAPDTRAAGDVLAAHLVSELPNCIVSVHEPGLGSGRLRVPAIARGEEVAAVVVDSKRSLTETEMALVSESVAHAAPSLHTLRTLALAERLASTDELTGLPNVRATHEALRRMFADAERGGRPLAAALLDLDRFKRVNDEHGHAKGDDVLGATAAVVSRTIRAGDFAGRLGGEEFLLLLPDTDSERAVQVAERVVQALRLVDVAELPLMVTGSIGVAAYPADAQSADELLRAADRAMYEAKAAGRDGVKAVTTVSA
jgi:diguanylate cyclase (GGDEF)-like protein